MSIVSATGRWRVAEPPDHRGLAWRLGGHLVLAALPLLAISAHVFGLVPMHLTAGIVVVPLLVVVVIVSALQPLEQDRLLLRAALAGALATAVYDTVRLDTVYILGWWGDFIPNIGAWILNTDDPVTGLVTDPGAAEIVLGYLWRYAGDGAGIGIWFFVIASALGLRDRGPGVTIAAAVAFAVAPVWAGLIVTVGLAPRATELMFPLTPTTLALSLLGHLIFGFVLGIGVARADRLERLWPWPQPRIPLLTDVLDRAHDRRARATGAFPAAGWSAALRAAGAPDRHQRSELTLLVPPVLEPRALSTETTTLVDPVPVELAPSRPWDSPPRRPQAHIEPTRGTARPVPRVPRPIPTPTGPQPAVVPAGLNRGQAPVTRFSVGPGATAQPAPPRGAGPRLPRDGADQVAVHRTAASSRPVHAWGRLSSLPGDGPTHTGPGSATS